LITDQSADDMKQNLSKGNLDAIISIKTDGKKGWTVYPPLSAHPQKAPFNIDVQYTSSSQKGSIFKSVLANIIYQINTVFQKQVDGKLGVSSPVELKKPPVTGREYKYIDFILPGQLGFSLLSSGVFGTAFVFISLRLTLVIKRFFATPVKKYSIVLGEAICPYRILLTWCAVYYYDRALRFWLYPDTWCGHGAKYAVLCAIGLIIFMGFGFTISGIAKSESTVPPLSNIITLPQFLLSGTFFSVTAFPTWLQYVSNALPLTHLNNAMRKVAFEGAGLGDVTHQLFILLLWGIGIYAVAVKTFKWE
jgi:ABC-2 type transport system permease protein